MRQANLATNVEWIEIHSIYIYQSKEEVMNINEDKEYFEFLEVHGLVARVVQRGEDLLDVVLRDVVRDGLEEEDHLGHGQRPAPVRVDAAEQGHQLLEKY